MATDSYKLSMGQTIFHQFPTYKTTWSFKCRNKGVHFTPEMLTEIEEQVDHYCKLRFKETELVWLARNLPWIKEDYIAFLRFWHPRREEIHINEMLQQGMDDSGLAIDCSGTWLNTSMYEIALLAIVNEVYFAFKYGPGAKNIEFQKRTMEKFSKIQSGEYNIGAFSEFGLRRRYSGEMQEWLVNFIVDQKIPGFIGTSNVHLARKYGIKATGTQAHEFIMCVGQGTREWNPAYSNKFALESWVKEYGIANGIALTDTITTDAFLLDFNQTYATLFSGVRHDSGDPIAWGEKLIAHYKKLGIDPKTKTLLFSDSLNFEKAAGIKKYFDGKINVAFGIGTFLSNPLDDPLNIVIKVTECNGMPVAKLSDVDGKNMCKDPKYIDYLKRTIDWRLRYDR
jgi:nicotinate phosphoribosyltransferase